MSATVDTTWKALKRDAESFCAILQERYGATSIYLHVVTPESFAETGIRVQRGNVYETYGMMKRFCIECEEHWREEERKE